MNWFSGLVVFLITWWTTLFAVIPFGRSYQGEKLHGSMGGTPTSFNWKRVALINTIVAIIIWLIIFALIESDVISFQRMVRGMPQ